MSDKVDISVGRRKCSVARVRLKPGNGEVTVNKRPMDKFFCRDSHRIMILSPFEITENTDKYDVFANVKGGGESGQAGAIRHGITRALLKIDPSLRPVLKKSGFIMRDPRMKERKKYGQKGARARFQFSKR